VPRFFRHLYRERELGTVAYDPLAYLLSIIALLALSLVFMPEACYVAIVVMTVGDGFAALAGRHLHGPRLPHSHKTWYGSLVGFVLAAAAGYLVAGPMAIAGAAGAWSRKRVRGNMIMLLRLAAALICTVLFAFFFP